MTGTVLVNEIYRFYNFAVRIRPDNIEEYFKECCFHFFPPSLSKGFWQKFICSSREAYHFLKNIFLFKPIQLAAHICIKYKRFYTSLAESKHACNITLHNGVIEKCDISHSISNNGNFSHFYCLWHRYIFMNRYIWHRYISWTVNSWGVD